MAGREPLHTGVLSALPDSLADPLIYFAAAKSDGPAVRLLAGLSGAAPAAVGETVILLTLSLHHD